MSDARAFTVADARRIGQGSSHLDADPTYARRLVRRISPYVSWFVATRTPFSADAVTSMSIGAGVAGGLLVAVGSLAADIAAILLLQVAYLLDVADGEVARIRGTAGRRGTYLDLIGHFLQNRALYAGAALSLVATSGGQTWAVGVGLVTMGFSIPFGLYARNHVLRAGDAGGHPDHGPHLAVRRPDGLDLIAWSGWAYRRVNFLWNYPASMNVFCLALLADAVRAAAGAATPLAVPVAIALFGPSLAIKQTAHAVRLLRTSDWR